MSCIEFLLFGMKVYILLFIELDDVRRLSSVDVGSSSEEEIMLNNKTVITIC